MPHDTDHPRDETLGRLLAVSRQLSASPDLERVLRVVIDAARDLLHAERATIFEYDASREELFTTVAHGLSAPNVAGSGAEAGVRMPRTAGIAGESAVTRRIVNVPDAHADPRFNRAVDRRTGFHTRSLLAIPLEDETGALIGVAEVLNRRGGPFTEADEQIAGALAAHAAVAIKRGRLIEDRLQREKLERDLDLARRIQQETFPALLPAVAGFDLAAWSEPADATGGDTYDAVPTATGATLLLADATGHGIGPALSVTQVRSMLRMAVRMNAGLGDIAHHLNRQLREDLPEGRFVSAWIGELGGAASAVTSFSAGQGPLLRYVAADDRFESIDADAPPLGIVPDLPVGPHRIEMARGDVLVVASDGIFEALGADDEPFGVARVEHAVRAARSENAGAIVRSLRDAMAEHDAGRPALDDRTVVLIRREGD